MQKIISLFQRNYDGDRLVRNEVAPGAEWVLAGEGVATRKFDGTCCMIRDGKLFRRYEVKPGGTPPDNFEPANEVDDNTGKQQGWVPVGDGPEDKWHREAMERRYRHHEMAKAFAEVANIKLRNEDGTYELIGPKIQGNPEGFDEHWLIRHGTEDMADCPRDFDGIKDFLQRSRDAITPSIEGIVWHHPDGRMVKIKGKDFGLTRGK